MLVIKSILKYQRLYGVFFLPPTNIIERLSQVTINCAILSFVANISYLKVNQKQEIENFFSIHYFYISL